MSYEGLSARAPTGRRMQSCGGRGGGALVAASRALVEARGTDHSPMQSRSGPGLPTVVPNPGPGRSERREAVAQSIGSDGFLYVCDKEPNLRRVISVSEAAHQPARALL